MSLFSNIARKLRTPPDILTDFAEVIDVDSDFFSLLNLNSLIHLINSKNFESSSLEFRGRYPRDNAASQLLLGALYVWQTRSKQANWYGSTRHGICKQRGKKDRLAVFLVKRNIMVL